MKLFIVESPSKAKTIRKYLGDDFEVIATKGHVVDLPKSKMGVDITRNFSVEWEIKNKNIINNIYKLSKKADEIFLATDKDREGEAIAYNVLKESGLIDDSAKPLKNKNIKRIVFTEVTKDAILHAIQNPRSIDMNTVHSQYARRILDRLVGYTLSPLLWKKVAFGLSAGRVQSVALRILVDREEERESFKPSETWTIQAKFSKSDESKKNINLIIKIAEKFADTLQVMNEATVKEDNSFLSNGDVFDLKAYEGNLLNINNQENATRLFEVIKNRRYVVKNISVSIQKRRPPFPLRTSTFQQAAINKLGINAKKAMSIAQSLYEKGLITYMRTDSVHMAEKVVQEVRKYVVQNFGENYLGNYDSLSKFKSKGASNKFAQEAHECIRPVSIFKNGEDLKLVGQELLVYNLIRNYAIASQMSEQVIQIYTTDVESLEGDILFRNNQSKVIFDGYQVIFNSEKSLSNDCLNSSNFKINDGVLMTDVMLCQHFTNPPPRYNEASLIKKLEKEGIGRPSTYASIISIIQQRTYVEKNGKYFKPTDIGRTVISLLKKYFTYIVDLEFTAKMEDGLDMIESAKLNWLDFLKDFYSKFNQDYLKADKSISRAEFTQLGRAPESVKCDLCGSSMLIKLGRFGKFFSCSNYPDCKGIKQYQDNYLSDKNIQIIDIDLTKYKDPPKTEEGVVYVLKKGRYGYFWAHPDYPRVKDIRQLEFLDEYLADKLGEPPLTDEGRRYILKKGRYGYFWAHPDYPKVKKIYKISSGVVL